MDFDHEKCSVVHTKGGVIFNSPCVTGTLLLSLEDNNRYLGILECDTILLKGVKEAVRKEYLDRIQALQNEFECK